MIITWAFKVWAYVNQGIKGIYLAISFRGFSLVLLVLLLGMGVAREDIGLDAVLLESVTKTLLSVLA